MHSIDERMLAFVAWHGEIPPEAEIIADFRARQDAIWILRLISGRSVDYVVGLALAERWWALRGRGWSVEWLDFRSRLTRYSMGMSFPLYDLAEVRALRPDIAPVEPFLRVTDPDLLAHLRLNAYVPLTRETDAGVAA